MYSFRAERRNSVQKNKLLCLVCTRIIQREIVKRAQNIFFIFLLLAGCCFFLLRFWYEIIFLVCNLLENCVKLIFTITKLSLTIAIRYNKTWMYRCECILCIDLDSTSRDCVCVGAQQDPRISFANLHCCELTGERAKERSHRFVFYSIKR